MRTTENLWLYVDERNEEWGPFTDDEKADIDCTPIRGAGPYHWERVVGGATLRIVA